MIPALPATVKFSLYSGYKTWYAILILLGTQL